MEGGSPQILFADDDRITRELVRAFFGRVGWGCELVADGDAAARVIAQRSFDVVITDFKMPKMDGLELLRWIHSYNPAQPVIVVTGAGSVPDLLRILHEGASDVIQKPLDLDSMERSVQRIVSANRQREFERSVYQFVSGERSQLAFSAKDIAGKRVPLLIAERLYRASAIDLNTKLKLELAFQEALTNSLEHGNLELESEWKEQFESDGIDRYTRVKRDRLADPTYCKRMVHIETTYDQGVLLITLRDEGTKRWIAPGDTRDTAEARASDPFCYGRGIVIMRSAMDEVVYSRDGHQVQMIKRLGGN